MCNYPDFVAVGIYWWLWWRTHSYPAGYCRYRGSDPTYSGTKRIAAIRPLAGEGEVFGKEMVGWSGKILPKLAIESAAAKR
jgi:hypothetical protein